MHPLQKQALENFDSTYIGFSKGSLSFVLIITRRLRDREEKTFPIDPDDLLTAKGGQVAGLGGGAIRRILNEHGIDRTLSDEGGRTSRGNIDRLRAYIEILNELWERRVLDLAEAERFWVERVLEYFDSRPFTLRLDPSKSFRYSIRNLLFQALERQREAAGTMYVGALMQHLVGAKIDLIVDDQLSHHGFSVADAPGNRAGDFLVGDVAVHVTNAPTDALLRKCHANLEKGLRPLIVTTEDGLGGAKAFAQQAAIEDRVEVIEIEQFLAANVYEWSFFKNDARPTAVQDLVERYNEIVAECESDPSLRIEFEP